MPTSTTQSGSVSPITEFDPITNDDAELNVLRDTIDDRTGFKVFVKLDPLKTEYTGHMTRKRSIDIESGQEGVRGKIDNFRGPERPEQNDVFLAVNEVKAEDL